MIRDLIHEAIFMTGIMAVTMLLVAIHGCATAKPDHPIPEPLDPVTDEVW